jgi:hypothetical protein
MKSTSNARSSVALGWYFGSVALKSMFRKFPV